MPIESWTTPEEAPDLAAHAAAMIDAALVGSGLARDAYWAAVRKGYNTPYNDPQPRAAKAVAAAASAPAEPASVFDVPDAAGLPVAVMAAAVAAEAHAP